MDTQDIRRFWFRRLAKTYQGRLAIRRLEETIREAVDASKKLAYQWAIGGCDADLTTYLYERKNFFRPLQKLFGIMDHEQATVIKIPLLGYL